MNATPKQTFFLFCQLGIDVRPCNLTIEQASNFISTLKKNGNKEEIREQLISKGAVEKNKMKEQKNWELLFDKGCEIGFEAGKMIVPTPMFVCQHEDPLNDNSKIEKVWRENDGVCGFASVVIKNLSFMAWLRKKNIGYKNYYGGWAVPIHDHNQSLTKKEAHAHAMAKFFQENGVDCYVDSRLD